MIQIHPRYAPTPTGKWDDGTGSGSPGFYYNSMEATFLFSLLVQAGVLVTSAIAIGTQNPMPEPLLLVLWMETIVQGIEIVWYGGVGVAYALGKMSISTSFRYLDWMFTTPIMLLSIFFFGTWESNKCTTLSELVEGWRLIAVILIFLFDWCMLWIGAAYQREWGTITIWLDGIINSCIGGGVAVGLWVGWIPFIGAFAPIVVAAIVDEWPMDGGALPTLIVSIVTWSLYGVVALGGRWEPFYKGSAWLGLTEESMNTSYNLREGTFKRRPGKRQLALARLICPPTHTSTTQSGCNFQKCHGPHHQRARAHRRLRQDVRAPAERAAARGLNREKMSARVHVCMDVTHTVLTHHTPTSTSLGRSRVTW